MPDQIDAVRDRDRIATLADLKLLDSPPEEPFDRLTKLAATILEAPVALVSLVDKDRQFFMSCPGLPEPWRTTRETPLSHSFCQHAVRTKEPLIIDDARLDPDFADNGAVEDLGVIAYAGIPLITATGYALGSFCVIDDQPRCWEAKEIEILQGLAASVMTEIELRAVLLREQAARRKAETATQISQQAAADLEVVDRRKTQFLATLAHELRNPLGAISSGVALLGMSQGEELQMVQELMQRQVGQMTRLVDDLLDVARIAEGKIRLSIERVELQKVVADAAETIAPTLRASGHMLRVDCPAASLEVEADHDRMVQVFCNLLTNACRYTPQGGHIAICAEQIEDRVEVTVSDNGVGIPAAKLPQIFDMFTQVEEAGGTKRGGLGIGLTLVRRIVELHGGHVAASSQGIDQGSEFRVCLPLAQ